MDPYADSRPFSPSMSEIDELPSFVVESGAKRTHSKHRSMLRPFRFLEKVPLGRYSGWAVEATASFVSRHTALKILPTVLLCLCVLGTIFWADSVMARSEIGGVRSDKNYSDLELSGSVSTAQAAISSFDADGRVAAGVSVGLHIFNVFVYTAALVMLVSWAWRHWLSYAKRLHTAWYKANVTPSLKPNNVRAPSAQHEIEKNFNNAMESVPEVHCWSTRCAGCAPSCSSLPMVRVFLFLGNWIVNYQLAVMLPYLFTHISVLVMLLSQEVVGPWPQIAMAFDILFLIGLASSLVYFFVSLSVHVCLSSSVRTRVCGACVCAPRPSN